MRPPTALIASSVRLRIPSFALAAVVLVLAPLLAAGCGGGDAPGSGTEGGRGDDPRASPAATTGTLRLGEETYEFTVRSCYLEGEDNNDASSTLRGNGTLPDGWSFEVLVDRTSAGAWLHHSVAMYVGDLGRPGSTSWEARRTRTGGSWSSFLTGSGDVPDEPLVVIEGNRLRAEGRFKQEDRVVEGRLEATCPG